MTTISRVPYALSVCAAAITLAGCGGTAQFPNPAAQTPLRNAGANDRVAYLDDTPTDAGPTRYTKHILYSFKGGNDGIGPSGRLLDKDGTFYGETAAGGGSSVCYNGAPGCGTVFELTPSGKSTSRRFSIDSRAQTETTATFHPVV